MMNAQALYDALLKAYNEPELRTLAFNMGVAADEIAAPGAARSVLARELVTWCERRSRLAELQAAIERERPNATAPPRRSRVAVDNGHTMDAWQGQQLDRLTVAMDGINDKISRVITQNAVLEKRVESIEARLTDLDERIKPTPTGATYTLASLALIMTVVLVYALYVLTMR